MSLYASLNDSDKLAQAVSLTPDAVAFARGWLGVEPHAGQARWLLAPDRPTMALVTGRRWGKSEAEAIKTLYRAIFTARPYRQLVTSITVDQARLIFDACVRYLQANSVLNSFVARYRESPFPTITLKNGSLITVRSTARKGIYVRGNKFDRVVVDEADYVPEAVIDDAIRMTLADVGGTLVLTSTPKPIRGLVWRTMRAAEDGSTVVYAQSGTTFENPHVNHDYINSLRPQMTEGAWLREVMGRYANDDAAVFLWKHIQAMYSGVTWELPQERQAGRLYVLGADVAKQQDWTVITVLDATEPTWHGVYWERFNRLDWPSVAARIRAVHNRYGCLTSMIDATGVGESVMDQTRDFATPFVFTSRSKVEVLTGLQLAIEQGRIKMPFVRQVVDELQTYEWNDRGLVTDSVMSLALAAHAAGPRTSVSFVESIF